MKRKVILGSSAVLATAIGVSVVMYAAISKSRTSSRPTQTAQNSPGSMRNELPHNGLLSREVAEASEKKTSVGGRAAQQVGPSPLNASPSSQSISNGSDKFSGTWVLDPARSEGLDPSMNQAMTVTQSGNVMHVKTSLSTSKRDWTVTDTYALNGQETEFTEQSSNGGMVHGTRISRLVNAGNGIEVHEQAKVSRQGDSMNVNAIRRWMLTDDKSLTIEMNVEGPHVNLHHRRVFVRK